MRKILYFFILTLSTLCCSKKEIEYCSPIKAVELLKNNPRIADSKTETGYYMISKEDENSLYFGYQTLNLKLERTLNPFYVTDKKEFYSIIKKTSDINIWNARSIVKQWHLKEYPELSYDSIKTNQTLEIKFIHNKTTDTYDARCTGWIDFHYSKMEKSTELNIDSVMTNYTLKKFDYNILIKNGETIDWVQSRKTTVNAINSK